MEQLYGWVRNITGYFLFLAVVGHLIPGKKYEKYFHLFAGMVAVLLVIQPLGKGLDLDERIARFYESLVFQYQARDFQAEMAGIEQERLQQMISHYEEAVAGDLRQMAGDLELEVYRCQVEIGRQEGTPMFGKVVRIQMTVGTDPSRETEAKKEMGRGETPAQAGEKERGKVPVQAGEEEQGEAPEQAGEEERRETVAQIEPVVIGGSEEKREGEEGGALQETLKAQEAEFSAVRRLRKKIVSYYDLEEAYVEIQVAQRQG